jgi:DNA repair protein RadA
MVQLPKEQGGLEGGALYLDTEQTFRPERIFQIAQARNLNPSKILKNIVYCQVYNSSHLEILLKEMGSIIKKNNIKLLIVDSIISHYRAEYLGRGELSERQQKLNEIMHRILRLAVIHNLAAIITNQVQGQPDIFFGDPIKPTGGNIIGHNATYRVYLRKIYGKNTTLRMAKMIDSPYHPNSECMFCVTEKGIEDMKDAEKMRFAEVRGA